MPKYRISYGFLYDVSVLGRVAATSYGNQPEDLGSISGGDDIEELDDLPEAYTTFSQYIVEGVVDDEAALEGLLAGNHGQARNVATKEDEEGVIRVPSSVVREYLLALDDLAGRITINHREHEYLFDAFSNVVVTLGQPLHPTEEDFEMNPEVVSNLGTLIGEASLELALSAYDDTDS